MKLQTPLGKVRGLGSAKEGTDHWWLQRVTAIANLPLVILFIIVIVNLVGTEHATVASRLGHPLVAIALLALLTSVGWHMRLGMQVVIEDYVHGESRKIAALLANNFFSIIIGLASLLAILKLSFGA